MFATASAPRWPGYQAASTAAHAGEPGHGLRAGPLEHDDGVRVRRGHGRMSPSWSSGAERVDQVDEVERGAVQALRRPLGREDDGHVARGGQRGRLGRVRPVVEPDRGGGRLRPDGRERRRRQPAHREPEAHERRSARRAALPPMGVTSADPPPESTPTSAWGPMTAMDAEAGRQGKDAAVLEEHRALLGHGLGDGEVRGRVDGAGRDRVVVEPHREDRAHDPVDHVVEPGLGHLPGRERVLHAPEVRGARHLHVEAGHRGGAAAVGPVPVGHDEARKRPVLLQDAR